MRRVRARLERSIAAGSIRVVTMGPGTGGFGFGGFGGGATPPADGPARPDATPDVVVGGPSSAHGSPAADGDRSDGRALDPSKGIVVD